MINKKYIIKIILLFLLSISIAFISNGQEIDTLNMPPLSDYDKGLKVKVDALINEENFIEKTLQTNKEKLEKCEYIFLIEYLLRLGRLNLDTELSENYNIFNHGCNCGNTYIVNKGITKGLHRLKNFKQGITPLMYAVKSQNVSVINLLLADLSDINATNEDGENCLLISVENNDNVDIVKLLEKHNINLAYKNKARWNYSAVEMALYSHHYKVTDYLLDKYILNKDTIFLRNSDLLNTALANLDTHYIRKLLPFYNINRKDAHQFEVIAELPEGYSMCSKFREEHNPMEGCALASTKDLDIEALKILIEYGYDINQVDSNNQNILFFSKNIEPVVKFLVSKNININQVDKKNKTALEYYIDEIVSPPTFDFNGHDTPTKEQDRDYKKELQLLAFYIENGAIINKIDKNGWHYIYNQAGINENSLLLKYLSKKYKRLIK